MTKAALLTTTTARRPEVFFLEPKPSAVIGMNNGVLIQEYFDPDILAFCDAMNDIAERIAGRRL